MGLFRKKKKKEEPIKDNESDDSKLVRHFIWVSEETQEEVDSGRVETNQEKDETPVTWVKKEDELKDEDVSKLLKKSHEFYKNKDWKSAMNCLDRILELDENNTIALLNKGVIYSKKEEYKKAITHYEKTEKQLRLKKKKTARLYFNWAAALYKLGDIEGAIEKNEKLIKEDPNFKSALHNRSAFRIKLKQQQENSNS
tara:strand:+ start:7387 stop:7980 length:594 start_codon:yes stop_codon:yes gene_type:complete